MHAICMASMAVRVLSGIDEDVLELQVSMDNLMAVHVLDAICKLLEGMPCLRHLRRPQPSKHWAGGSWSRFGPSNSIAKCCKIIYILEIYIDHHRSTTDCYLRLCVFNPVWSLFDLCLCYFVFQSRLYTSLWSASLSLSLRFSLFETACSRSPPWRPRRPRGHKISSEADENGWWDDQKQKRFADVCTLIRSV